MAIGLVGLGIMGGSVAEHLLRTGATLYVHDIDKEKELVLARQGALVAKLQGMAPSCDIIFLSLPSGRQVRQVLFGEQGFAGHMAAGAIVCDLSSISRGEAVEFSQRLSRQGIGFLDCPVTGGSAGAKTGALYAMCGGSKADYNKVLPYLKSFTALCTHVGSSGAGSIAKLVNNMLVFINTTAVAEAFSLGLRYGVDPQLLFQAIKGGSAGSRMLETKLPKMLAHEFSPGGRITTAIKDMQNAQDAAQELGCTLPLSALVQAQFEELVNLSGECDFSCVALWYEKLLSTSFAPDKAHE